MAIQKIQAPKTRQEFKDILKKYKSYSVFVKAYATWCNPCKAIAPYIEKKMNEVSSKSIVYVLLDVDEQSDVASHLKVRSMPTMMLFKDGSLEMVVEGANPKEIDQMFLKI